MTPSTYIQPARPRLGLLVTALALLPLAGCFHSPDVSKIICTGEKTCPGGYSCVFATANSTQGKCEVVSTGQDGRNIDTTISVDGISVTDSNRGVDGAIPLDGSALDASVDQPSAGTFDGLTSGPDMLLAIDVVAGPEVQPDVPLPDAPIDATKPPVDAPPTDVAPADIPIQQPEVGSGCTTATDCPGPCQTCSTSSHACVAVVSQDDPSGHCVGTCDATGACKAKQGQTCQASGTCATGLACSPDGHCCDRACTGPCESCESGVCTAVTGSPHTGHATCAGSTAECNGTCTGATDGRCTWPPNPCGQASCTTIANAQAQPVGTSFIPQGTCSSGACSPGTATSCANGLVCASATACKTTCAIDSDCLTGNTCSAGACVGKKANGLACTTAAECLNGNCVDGYCCESACAGTCMACSAAKTGTTNGFCRPVTAGTDPDIECSVDTGNVCGHDGMCDGAGACRNQSASTPCGTASCTGQGTYTPLGHCSGSGSCVAGTPGPCPNNMLCASPTTCTTTCTNLSTTGCPSGYKCVFGGTSCIVDNITCGPSSCPTANGGICCTTRPTGTDTTTPWTYTCTSPAVCSGSADYNDQVVCGTRADCPGGQICCMTGISCDGSGGPSQSSFCTADATKCQNGPFNWGYQICDPGVSPTECLTGSCQTWGCVGGLYACQ